MSFIPIVDFSKLSRIGNVISTTKDDKHVFDELAKELGEKLHKIGFVYIVNHGISQHVIDEARSEASNFFKLQKAIKQKYLKTISSNYHGYSEPGQEILNVEEQTYEYKEAFDVYGENRFYPEEIPYLKNSLETFEKNFKELAQKIYRMIGIALDLEDEDSLYKISQGLSNGDIPNSSLVRVVCYPAIDDNTQLPQGSVRCGAHTDYGMLTLLFQDPIGGLEVKNTDGKWQQATPIPGSLLVNIGATLEIISGKYFPATMHRVPIPDLEKLRTTSRTSIGLFTYPDVSIYKTT